MWVSALSGIVERGAGLSARRRLAIAAVPFRRAHCSWYRRRPVMMRPTVTRLAGRPKGSQPGSPSSRNRTSEDTMTHPEPATYGEAMAAGAAYDADPAVVRVGSHHARHQAERHAKRLAHLGAWCGLSADGFGVWVSRDTWETASFVFNGDYDDLEQARPFFAAFLEVHAALTEEGKYPYNDSFRGRIGVTGDEDAAIYLCQHLLRADQSAGKVARYLADGWEPLDSVTEITRFAGVVYYGFYSGGGGWSEWPDARLVPEDNPRQAAVTGGIRALLPKGKRTHGVSIQCGGEAKGRLLVKR